MTHCICNPEAEARRETSAHSVECLTQAIESLTPGGLGISYAIEEPPRTAVDVWAEAFDLMYSYGVGLLGKSDPRIREAWDDQHRRLRDEARAEEMEIDNG